MLEKVNPLAPTETRINPVKTWIDMLGYCESLTAHPYWLATRRGQIAHLPVIVVSQGVSDTRNV